MSAPSSADGFPRAVRVRTGVARFEDGWNVVVNFDGKRMVYDPTYATEAEAEAKAVEVAAALRDPKQRRPDERQR